MPLYFFLLLQGRKCGSMLSSRALRSPSPMAILGDTGRGDCVTDQSQSPTEGFIRRSHSSRAFACIIQIPSTEENCMRMLYKAGCHRLTSVTMSQLPSLETESGWLQRTSGPILGSPPSLTCSLMHGGPVASDITVQPTVASVASPEKTDLSPEQVSLDSYLAA